MIERIHRCKVYATIIRKEKIDEAIENPINQELVKQLMEYLDDEYIPEENVETTDDTETELPDDESMNEDDFDMEQDDMDMESPWENVVPENVPPAPQEANASVKIDKQKTVTSAMYTNIQQNEINLTDLPSEIKDTLNADASTNCVSRVLIKDDELWVYYDDSINLNNIMENAIDLLNRANYYYLSFNRLARSNNAIVFTMSFTDTDNIMS